MLFFSLFAAALVLPHPVREWTVRALVLLRLVVVGVYVGMAVLICGSLGWPAPSKSFFATAAQIDATLLVAVSVVIGAPSAWRRSLQDHFAFVAGGILMAALGLGASVTGAVSSRAGEVLLALAVSR